MPAETHAPAEKVAPTAPGEGEGRGERKREREREREREKRQVLKRSMHHSYPAVRVTGNQTTHCKLNLVRDRTCVNRSLAQKDLFLPPL